MIRKSVAILLLLISFFTVSATAAVAPTPIQPVSDSLFHDIYEPSEIIFDSNVKHLETKPPIVLPLSSPQVVTKTPKVSNIGFKLDRNVSWYGPGFYGNRTACGQKYTKTILGVAHRTLPCGTLVTFMWEGRKATVPVIDRGPYCCGRVWDLSGGLCIKLHHCFTGAIYYHIEGK